MEAWNAKLDMGAKKGLDINIENGTKQIKILAPKSGSHLKIGLQPLKEASLSTTVLYLQQEVLKVSEGCENINEIAAKTINHEYLTRFHKGSGHKSAKNMMHALSQAEMVSPNTRRVVKDVISRCKECKKFGKSLPKPKTTLPKVSDTNQIITWDLKDWNGKYIMWMIDSFSRFVKGVVINNKTKETILKVLYYHWCCMLGYPSQGFWADNGGEFRNDTMAEFVEKCSLTLKFGPSHSPWSNGINERNHGICDIIVKKALEHDKSLSLQEAVNIAAWSHNTNVNKLGYSPMQLQLGKAVVLPGFTEGNIVTESDFDSELVEKLIRNKKNAVKNYNVANFSQKISEAVATRVPRYTGKVYKKNEEVYIQKEDKKRWCGPVKVIHHEGSNVWVMYNGGLLKIAECRVQPVYSEAELIAKASNSDKGRKSNISFSNDVTFPDVPVEIKDDSKSSSSNQNIEDGSN